MTSRFYVRPGRAAEYGEAVDLDLFDVRRRVRGQRVVQKWPVRYREVLEPDHDFDLIVLSVPHHRLPEATAFLAPRVGKATVLVFGNIWTEPSAAIGALPLDRIAGDETDRRGAHGLDVTTTRGDTDQARHRAGSGAQRRRLDRIDRFGQGLAFLECVRGKQGGTARLRPRWLSD